MSFLPLKLCWYLQKLQQSNSVALSERNKETWQTSSALDEPWNSILKMNKSHDAKSDPLQPWFASQTGLHITNYQIPAGRVMFSKQSLWEKEIRKRSYNLEKSHLDKERVSSHAWPSPGFIFQRTLVFQMFLWDVTFSIMNKYHTVLLIRHPKCFHCNYGNPKSAASGMEWAKRRRRR